MEDSMTFKEWTQLMVDLRAEGYQEVFNADDAEANNAVPCKCNLRRAYRGMKKLGSYRAFSICRTCDDVYEF